MMSTQKNSTDQILKLLSEIPDPEIPVINIIELGILRDVKLEDDLCTVVITPTYTGCPAMKVIEDDIRIKLKEIGIENVKVELVYTPAWTTDWISDEAKEKLRAYGIAPPDHTSVDKKVLLGKLRELKCPQCGSKNTEMISQFLQPVKHSIVVSIVKNLSIILNASEKQLRHNFTFR
jgi:ring-1,2-phenylacetyl-CoA epoxidase subunit PaaD